MMQRELGDFLRSRRGKLSPRDVGLVGGRRRRTNGLRREEVAELAGIGVDWYTRLEQGRSVTPSLATLDALTRALKLDGAEAQHLRALAAAGQRGPFVRETPPETVVRIVEALNAPAYITGKRFDVLAWNAAADALLSFSRLDEPDRNILVTVLTKRASRSVFGERWAEEAQRLIALFRPAHDIWADDPAFAGLVARLKRECPEFEGWWERRDVRAPAAGRKILTRPDREAMQFEYASFQSNDNPDLRLAIWRRC